VTGGVLGVVLSIVVGFGVSLYFIRSYQHADSQTGIDRKEVFLFTLPVLLQTAASTSFMSADLILVKHFFPEFEVGVFAAVSTLGKIILFASAPVAAVMFPIVSRKFAKKEPFILIFLFSLLMTFGAGLVLLCGYGLFPQLVLTMLYGIKYLSGTSLILPYGVFCVLLSLTSVFTNFYLSTGQKNTIWFLAAAALCQIGGIELFHQSLFQVILVNIVVLMLLLILLTIYFILNLKKYHFKKKLLPE
jgi:O-antigen/teichoic acid export membrane protein